MLISTKLRLISMKNGIKGDVARIVLDNLRDTSNMGVVEFMRDVFNNGCAYSNIRGLKYHGEMQEFCDRNKMDIELIISMYQINGGTIEIINDKNTARGWHCFETVIGELMQKLKIE